MKIRKSFLNRNPIRRERSQNYVFPGNFYTMNPFIEEFWNSSNYIYNVFPLGGANISPPWNLTAGLRCELQLGLLQVGNGIGTGTLNINQNLIKLDNTKPFQANWLARFDENANGDFAYVNFGSLAGVKLLNNAGVLQLLVIDGTGAIVFTQNLAYTFGSQVYVSVQQVYDGKGNMIVACNVNGTGTLPTKQFVTSQNVQIPTTTQYTLQAQTFANVPNFIGPVTAQGFHV